MLLQGLSAAFLVLLIFSELLQDLIYGMLTHQVADRRVTWFEETGAYYLFWYATTASAAVVTYARVAWLL